MNKRNPLLFLALAMLIFVLSFSSSNILTNAIETLTSNGGEWVLKIDDITIYEDKFNQEFNFAIERDANMSPTQKAVLKSSEIVKQQFLDGLTSQILLLNNAQSEGFFETKEAKDYIWSALRMVYIEYYTQKLMEEAMEDIADPTPEQIAMVYEQNRVALAQQYGITELNVQAINYISQMMKRDQAQQRVYMMMSELKDKTRIDRNIDIIGK